MSENKIHKKQYSICENMFISFIITFASGTICYEGYIPEGLAKIYRTLIFVICLLTWIVLSVISGAQNKWQYEIFTILFWLIPPLAIYLSNDGPEVFRMSISMYLLSELFTIMFRTPAEAVGEVFRMGAVPVILIVVLICTFAFLAGNLFQTN